MKSVLLLATTTGYQIRSFGDAADRLGIHLVFASDRCDQLDDPWWDHAIPVRFHEEQRSVDAVVAGLRDVSPEGVLAVGDRPTVLAALVAQRLGLPGNPPAAAAASRNKLTSRRELTRAGLASPEFRQTPLSADVLVVGRTIAYPAVVKPLALSGSRGVMRVDNAGELATAFERLRTLLDEVDVRMEQDAVHEVVLIEAFIPGREFAVEGVLTAGSLRVLAIFDKPDPLDGPFFEETIYVTPSRASASVQTAISDAVTRACGALGLWHGPIHAECRVNENGVYMLEVAARPIGGLCSRALRFEPATGKPSPRVTHSLEEILLRHAIGDDVTGVVREEQASAVMMIPIPRRGLYKGVVGLEEARAGVGIDEIRITAKLDTVVVPLPEGRSYLGFIFAHAATPEGAEAAVRAAHAHLRFEIARELPVL